ncbi:group II intron reverse transcriptase/maturase [Cetobacterium somerae]|uniref:reverse transcriptase/maturase family protein n=1 Tax=Cetobacterium somerae TaxID=188913 RepID=UPI00211E6CAA|nr:reverse transcriptase/maturase family protein [Cetobacterium somerae]MCQ9628373.1 group II intron reverse transcriptase/maturase [Cetobacterium somerae]
MRNSENVLYNLGEKSKIEDYKFEKLIRNLYNENFYYIAISKLYANKGAGTKGSDNKSIDGFSNYDILKLIESIKDESYEPAILKRVYIPKSNGKLRPLSIPSFRDKIVQEIIRMILNAIYEPIFSKNSHGFRPNRSCHTALKDVNVKFTGTKWFIEGDIKGCFDNINHHILLRILDQKISDQKFLRLINKFLKCGYLENWRYSKTYSGTPQGGIMSPILANIYLNEFDKFMEKLKRRFDIGKRRTKQNKEYRRKTSILNARRKKRDKNKSTELLSEIKSIEKELMKISYYDTMDENFKSLKYVRYADDFIIGVIGSKEDCEWIKEEIKNYMNEKLNLNLSEEKTLITNIDKRAKFLGYELTKKSTRIKTNEKGRPERIANGNIELYIPRDFAINWMLNNNAISYNIDRKSWSSVARYSLINLSHLEIISTYNNEIRGIYNYYKMAKNVHRQLSTLIYGMEYSCLSTLARKHKSSRKKIRSKLGKENGWGVDYNTKEGKRTILFFNSPIERELFPVTWENIDVKYNVMTLKGRTELEDRLKANQCELCGINGSDIEFHIHHINKLKTIKEKEKKSKWMIQMIARNRKTLVVCTKCVNGKFLLLFF